MEVCHARGLWQHPHEPIGSRVREELQMRPGKGTHRLRRRVAIIVAVLAALAGVVAGTQAALASNDVTWGYPASIDG